MIVPDLNLLLYAHNDGAPQFAEARRWWESLLNGTERVGIPWIVAVGFIRLSTKPAVLDSPFSPENAVNTVEEWFSFPHVAPLNPGPGHLDRVRSLLAVAGTGGNLVNDAHIATLALEHGAEVDSGVEDPSAPGATALHGAAVRGDLKGVKVLLRYGADPRSRNADGKRPVEVTRNKKVRELLEKA